MSYRFKGLSPELFAPYFALDATAPVAEDVDIVIADSKLGFPCRVSLEDAEPGERLILLAFEHQPANSPYRASGPIFVRGGAVPYNGTAVPPALRSRLLSLRAYDRSGRMVDADVVDGQDVEGLVERLFAHPETDHIHVHYARRGCFACRVERTS